MYRIRYVSDGGPVAKDNRFGWPHSTCSSRSLFVALKRMRDIAGSDARVGTVLGLGLQIRLFPNTPWSWIEPKDVERYAREMRISNWKPFVLTSGT